MCNKNEDCKLTSEILQGSFSWSHNKEENVALKFFERISFSQNIQATNMSEISWVLPFLFDISLEHSSKIIWKDFLFSKYSNYKYVWNIMSITFPFRHFFGKVMQSRDIEWCIIVTRILHTIHILYWFLKVWIVNWLLKFFKGFFLIT